MSEHGGGKLYPIEEALQAQRALRELAGLEPEMFPLEAFVGMISDEVEALRQRGFSDQRIVQAIQSHSKIEITSAELAEHYASPEQRHAPRE